MPQLYKARSWPCNPLCPLCGATPETTQHICLQCPFAQRVWELVQVWTHDLVTKPTVDANIEDWWIQSLQNIPKEQRRTKAAVIMYTAWNLWKERNKRIFEAEEADRVAGQLTLSSVWHPGCFLVFFMTYFSLCVVSSILLCNHHFVRSELSLILI